MKSTLPAIVLSALWILGGSWWLSNNLSAEDTLVPMFSFTDGAFRVDATDNFSFQYNSSKLSLTEKTRAAFAKIAKHLKQEKKPLTLIGLYATSEKNDNKNFENLGLARAAAVKKELLKLAVPSAQIETKAQAVNSRSFANRTLYGGVNFILANAGSAGFSSMTEKPSTHLSLEKAYFFNVESNDFKVAEYEDFKEYLAMLRNYLEQYPEARISVTPFTNDASEKNIAAHWGRKVRRSMEAYGIRKLNIKKKSPEISLDAPDDRLFTRVEVQLEN